MICGKAFSLYQNHFIFKIRYISILFLPQFILLFKTSYLRTTLRNRSGVSSLHNRGATTVRTDYTQLGFPIHTAYVALKLAYANSSHDFPNTGPRSYATREHSTPLPSGHPQCNCPGQPSSATRVHATPAISPRPVRGCRVQ